VWGDQWPMQSRIETLSDLIGSIYDRALDSSRLDRTLAEVRDAFDCRAP
jgi:hypothetical protein